MKKGRAVVEQGAPGDELFLLLDGVLDVDRRRRAGRRGRPRGDPRRARHARRRTPHRDAPGPDEVPGRGRSRRCRRSRRARRAERGPPPRGAAVASRARDERPERSTTRRSPPRSARHLGDAVEVENLRRLSGGASRETWSFDASPRTGRVTRSVLRRDPGATCVDRRPRATEFDVLRAAAGAGVARARGAVPARARRRAGPGLRDGPRSRARRSPAGSSATTSSPRARPLLAAQCGEQAARIHAVPLDDAARSSRVLDAAAQVDQYRQVLDGIGEPHPAFELGLRRLAAEHRPTRSSRGSCTATSATATSSSAPTACAPCSTGSSPHLGDPAEDLAWCCVRSWRFGVVDLPVGGFGTTDDAPRRVRRGRRRAASTRRGCAWWEAFGTLKWGLICGIQAHTHLGGLVRSVELATLGRRIAETEWDLLRLLVPDGSGSRRPAVEPARRRSRHAVVVPGPADRGRAPRGRARVRRARRATRARGARGVPRPRRGERARHRRAGARPRPGDRRAGRPRLAALLGRSGTPRELADALAGAIRDGSLDDREAETSSTRSARSCTPSSRSPTPATRTPERTIASGRCGSVTDASSDSSSSCSRVRPPHPSAASARSQEQPDRCKERPGSQRRPCVGPVTDESGGGGDALTIAAVRRGRRWRSPASRSSSCAASSRRGRRPRAGRPR